jgi:methanethiol S-methyltransferase
MTDIVSVVIVAVAWCTLHSVLITRSFERGIRTRCGRLAAWHRLSYNLISVATLAWCWLEFRERPGDYLWGWHGWWQIPRLAGLALAAWFGWLGVRAHDNRAFLGLRQIKEMHADRDVTPPVLTRDGVLGLIRHPYYFAGILVVALYADFSTTTIAWRAVFVLYLLLGTWLEERKLLAVFGDAYREYRREVPALWPRRLKP